MLSLHSVSRDATNECQPVKIADLFHTCNVRLRRKWTSTATSAIQRVPGELRLRLSDLDGRWGVGVHGRGGLEEEDSRAVECSVDSLAAMLQQAIFQGSSPPITTGGEAGGAASTPTAVPALQLYSISPI